MQSFMWYEAGMNYTGGSQKCIKGWEMVVWITIGKGASVILPENPLIRHNVIAILPWSQKVRCVSPVMAGARM